MRVRRRIDGPALLKQPGERNPVLVRQFQKRSRQGGGEAAAKIDGAGSYLKTHERGIAAGGGAERRGRSPGASGRFVLLRSRRDEEAP